jgi:hypothetical protein
VMDEAVKSKPTLSSRARGFAAMMRAGAFEPNDAAMVADILEASALALDWTTPLIEASRALVYDGQSDAGWHRVKRAVLEMERHRNG